MIHEPKMLYNTSGEVVEVFSLGKMIRFEPEESRMVEGDVAYQILTNQKTPLQEVKVKPVLPNTQEEKKVSEDSAAKGMKLSDYTYLELKAKAQKIGVWKNGVSKKDLILLLESHGQS